MSLMPFSSGSFASIFLTQFLQSMVGRCEQVLFENKLKDGSFVGYTKNYTPIRVISNDNLSGKILDVIITDAKDDYCVGEVK